MEIILPPFLELRPCASLRVPEVMSLDTQMVQRRRDAQGHDTPPFLFDKFSSCLVVLQTGYIATGETGIQTIRLHELTSWVVWK